MFIIHIYSLHSPTEEIISQKRAKNINVSKRGGEVRKKRKTVFSLLLLLSRSDATFLQKSFFLHLKTNLKKELFFYFKINS